MLCFPFARVLAVCSDLRKASISLFTTAQNLIGSLAIILIGSRDKDFKNPSHGVYEEILYKKQLTTDTG